MNELVGKVCFVRMLDSSGGLAYLVEAVDMPMVKLDGVWTNCAAMRSISPSEDPWEIEDCIARASKRKATQA